MEAHEIIYQNQNDLLNSGECNLIEDAFTLAMMDLLVDGCVIETPRLSYYSHQKGQREIWRLNGFTANQEDSKNTKDSEYHLELFITDYSDSNELEMTSKKEMILLKNKLLKFLEACLAGDTEIIQEHHISSQLARDIYKNRAIITKVSLFILTNKKFTNIHKQLTNETLNEIDIVIHYWDITRFNALVSNTDYRNVLDININEYQPNGLECIEVSSSDYYKCYLSVINAELLADLYRDYDTKLLESNVRSFLQQTGKVNKGIRDTIINNSKMFLPYNNGLSATASEIKLNDKKEIIEISDFQIVNGGQTTASLYYTRKKHKASLENVNVALKLTILKDEKLKALEVPLISKFANTQNKVSELDLSSNHIYLIEMEKLSKSVSFYDVNDKSQSKFWFFERANGQYRESLSKEGTDTRKKVFRHKYPTAFKFKKADISKWSNLFENKPYLVSQGAQKNFLDFIKNTADHLNDTIDKHYYIETIGKGVVFKWFDKCYGRYNTDPIGDTNIKSYVVSYSISLVNIYLGDSLDLLKIAKNQEIDSSLREDTRRLLTHTYDFLIKKADGGMVSELAKKKDTWNEYNKIKPQISIKNIFKDYITEGRKSSDRDKREYLIDIDRLISKGSPYWDALKIFSSSEHSGNDLSPVERNHIEKGYTYFFRLRSTLSFAYLSKLLELTEKIENNFVVSEIMQLSNRQPKSFPVLIDMHDRLLTMTEDDLKVIEVKIKASKSKSKQKSLNAFKAFNISRFNYEEMTLDELRYFAWGILRFSKKKTVNQS